MEDKRLPNWTRRALGAFWVGVLVAGTAYLLAFRELRDNLATFRYMDVTAMHELDVVEREVEEYRKTTGHLPGDLAALEKAVGRPPPHDDPIRIVDPWRHPYQYRVDGNGFVLFSFGRDGRPGGIGIDADLYPSSSGRPFERPTFRQFALQMKETRGVWAACILTGVLAAAAFLASSGELRWRDRYIPALASAVVSILISIILTAPAVPSGH